MAIMMDKKPEKDDDKYENKQGEIDTWEAIEKYLPDDEVVCFYNREVDGQEFDFCLLIKNLGVVIIEVKGWAVQHIKEVRSPNEIYLIDQDNPEKSPKQQANGYRNKMIDVLKKCGINKGKSKTIIKTMVCYPHLHSVDYDECGLRIVSEPDITLFEDDIDKREVIMGKIYCALKNERYYEYYDKFTEKKVRDIENILKNENDKYIMDNHTYDIIRNHFDHKYEIGSSVEIPDYSALYVFDGKIDQTEEDGTDKTDEIDEIIESYFKGTKHIIFTNYRQDIDRLAERLTKEFNKRHIKISGSSLEFRGENSEETEVVAENGRISLFNFEATYISDSDYHFVDSFTVYNGKFSSIQKDVLEKIAEHSTFNINQYEIEHAEINRDIEIKAGAGTGKTYSMVSRIAYLCHPSTDSGISDASKEIAMLTFTVAAANNMKSRLKKYFLNAFILSTDVRYLDMVNNVGKMRISTIHSFANELIKYTSTVVGVGTNFSTVTSPYGKKEIFERNFNEYIKNKNDPLFFKQFPQQFDYFKNNIFKFSGMLYSKGFDIKEVSMNAFGTPNSKVPFMNELIEGVIIKTEKEYERKLVEKNSLHQSESMIYLNRCIESEAFNTHLFKYKYMFIDEFQDTDDAQISAFSKMQEKLSFNFFIVGDLKQSIYRFRGAKLDAFETMGCKGDEWLHFTLNLNYRSDKRLLARYEKMFDDIGDDGKKRLHYKEEEDKLVGVKTTDEYEDSEVVTCCIPDSDSDDAVCDKLFEIIADEKKKIEAIMEKRKLSREERTIAVLLRTNAQINTIMTKAKRKKSSFVIESSSAKDLCQYESSLDLCKLTSALCNPYNTTYLYDFIQSNYVSTQNKVLLSELADKSEKEKREILIGALNETIGYVFGKGEDSKVKTWEDIVSDAHQQPVLKTLRTIYEKCKPYVQYSSKPKTQQEYRKNSDFLFEKLSNIKSSPYLTLDGVNEYLHNFIEIGSDTKSHEIADDSGDVRIVCVTVHKSKGLEYGTVIMPFTDKALGTAQKNSLDVTINGDEVGYCFNISNNNRIDNDYYNVKKEKDESIKEEARILYVAMTRAINKFIWIHKLTKNKDAETWRDWLEQLEED